MSDEPAFLVAIATPNPDGQEEMQSYVTAAGELAAANGVKPIGRFMFAEALAGDDFPDMVVVMEFPSAQALRDAFAADEYKKLIPARDKGFKEIRIFRAERA